MSLKAFIGHILLRCFSLLLILSACAVSFKGILEGTRPFMMQQSDFFYDRAMRTYDMKIREKWHYQAIIKYQSSYENILRIKHLNQTPEQHKEYNSKSIWIPIQI